MSVEENGRLIQSSRIIPAAGPRYQRRCKGRFDALPLRALLLFLPPRSARLRRNQSCCGPRVEEGRRREVDEPGGVIRELTEGLFSRGGESGVDVLSEGEGDR